MHRSPLPLLLCILLCCLVHADRPATITTGKPDGSELWGYVQVRESKGPPVLVVLQEPAACTSTAGKPMADRSLRGTSSELLVLQAPDVRDWAAGPQHGASRNDVGTWLNKADLIFVERSADTGFSYAEDEYGRTKGASQALTDVMELLKVLQKEIPTLQSSPLFFFRGTHAAMVAFSAGQAIAAGTLNITVGGMINRIAPLSNSLTRKKVCE
ncbi:hypothetical protein BAE44_0002793 [Dichanthelium oligosanthes]|uniref:Uncharacterized protein n=1 Tax=Dichanthelium oligosanthes TaxID=888268 RepID=A0A1E5WFM3_9POAL|nr:hypothetical protein BAE44_0002793 [Dichanthelium oligosanthes]